jgi:2'-5' RNA ligase
MARLFVAVWPPAPVVERLRSLPRPDTPGVRWVPPPHWHVTVRFFGDAEPADAVASIAGTPLPIATAVLGPAVRRLGPSALVVPVSGLDDLAAAVGDATAGVGLPRGSRSFTGHLTLARLRRGATDKLTGALIAAEFHVAEIVLVRSDLSPDGASYEVIGRWPVGECTSEA